MKTYISLIITLFIGSIAFTQEDVKIIFDVTSNDEGVHKSTIRHIKAMSKNYPHGQFEIVMYSGAMNMVLKNKSTVAKDLEELAKKDNVDFVICEGTMRRHKTEKGQLIEGVRSVPDGILEIVQKQQDGWGYIKEGQ